MGNSHAGRIVTLICVLTSANGLAPGNTGLAASPERESLSVLDIRLTVASQLPRLTRVSLLAETEAIWRLAGVRIRWASGAADPATRSLTVLVMPHLNSGNAEGSHWAVGELRRFDGQGVMAFASIAGAQRILDDSAGQRFADLPAVRERRLGLVLGRAVAHEIGHYLLNTNTHARRGLMRASFDSREFSDLRRDLFALDDDAEASLRAAADPFAVSPGTVPLIGFSYNSYNPR